MLPEFDFINRVGQISQDLEALGLKPVLVGGMALILLGSQRVTKDFDFIVSHPQEDWDAVVKIFYDQGFELVSRLDKNGAVIATIDNRKVAAIRLRLDAPNSAYFFNPKIGLKIDLLFDFPLAASELFIKAKKATIQGYTLEVASETDLIRLKEIAKANRDSSRDREDLVFLESLAKKK